MADYLFVSQDMIDGWLMEGKIDFSGTVMSIRGEAKRYELEPAVRFVRIVGDEPDSAGLVAKVKTLEQVAADGGEHYHDSVVLGDVAYDVQNGFIARVHVPDEVASAILQRAEDSGGTSSSSAAERGIGPAAAHTSSSREASDEPRGARGASSPSVEPVKEPREVAASAPEEPRAAAAARPEAREAEQARADEPSPGEKESDEALLTRFLLENLR